MTSSPDARARAADAGIVPDAGEPAVQNAAPRSASSVGAMRASAGAAPPPMAAASSVVGPDAGPGAGTAARAGAAASATAGTAGSGPKPGAGDRGAAGSGSDCAPDLDASHPPSRLSLSGALSLSDPALIEVKGTYYAFGTGPGIVTRTSTDLLNWQDTGSAFAVNPAWIARSIPDATDLWSPDVSFFGGLYHLYYAVSKQGDKRSCIGHATAPSPAGPYTDQGAVLCSNLVKEDDDWNAIHPNVVQDETNRRYLVFGSFWSGVKLVSLDAMGQPSSEELSSLAKRPQHGGAIEAPYIIQRCGYYYLFVSFDLCCDGVNSTYKIYVGRSRDVSGPYVDRDGMAMLDGGGTLLVSGDDTWHGPGHSAVLRSKERWYEAHHAYYAGEPSLQYARGQPYLRISELAWDAAGWPVSGGP